MGTPMGANWGLRVAISMDALNRFTQSATALKTGSGKLLTAGKNAEKMITSLGSVLGTQADNLEKKIKSLQDTIKSAKQDFKDGLGGSGGGYGGGGMMFGKVTPGRQKPQPGDTTRSPRNATDTNLRKHLGITKDAWDLLANRSDKFAANHVRAYLGNIPKPQRVQVGPDKGRRYFDSNQMMAVMLTTKVAYPIVKAIEALKAVMSGKGYNENLSQTNPPPQATEVISHRNAEAIINQNNARAEAKRGKKTAPPPTAPDSMARVNAKAKEVERVVKDKLAKGMTEALSTLGSDIRPPAPAPKPRKQRPTPTAPAESDRASLVALLRGAKLQTLSGPWSGGKKVPLEEAPYEKIQKAAAIIQSRMKPPATPAPVAPTSTRKGRQPVAPTPPAKPVVTDSFADIPEDPRERKKQATERFKALPKTVQQHMRQGMRQRPQTYNALTLETNTFKPKDVTRKDEGYDDEIPPSWKLRNIPEPKKKKQSRQQRADALAELQERFRVIVGGHAVSQQGMAIVPEREQGNVRRQTFETEEDRKAYNLKLGKKYAANKLLVQNPTKLLDRVQTQFRTTPSELQRSLGGIYKDPKFAEKLLEPLAQQMEAVGRVKKGFTGDKLKEHLSVKYGGDVVSQVQGMATEIEDLRRHTRAKNKLLRMRKPESTGDEGSTFGAKEAIATEYSYPGGKQDKRKNANGFFQSWNNVFDVRTSMQSPGSFRKKFDSALNWSTAAGVVYGGGRTAVDSVKQMADFEEAMIKVKKVINPLNADMGHLSETAKKMGQEFGVSINDVADAMQIFAQQGLNMNDIIRQTKVAVLAANVTDLDLVDATEALTAAQKQFLMGQQSGMRILDAWNEVENTTAVNAVTLTKALEKAGTSARVAGVDFDTFNGIVAAVGEATRKGGDEIGTAMKFIFQHMREDDAVSALQQVGIYTEDAAGNMKSARNVVAELAGKWDDLTDSEKQNVAVSVAGTRHLNDFFVLMETWHRAIDISVTSLNSQGSAMRENRIVMESLNKQAGELKATWQSLWADIGQSGALDVLKSMASTLKVVLQGFGAVNSATGGMAAGLVGNGALVGGGLGALSYFGGTILPAALMKGSAPNDKAMLEVQKRRQQGGARIRYLGSSAESMAPGGLPPEYHMLWEEQMAMGDPAVQGARFWQGRQKSGVGLMMAGALGSYAYNKYGKEAGIGQSPTGRDTTAAIGSTALETAGMINLFSKPGVPFMKQGKGRLGVLAALGAAGAATAYGQYQDYKRGKEGTPRGFEDEYNRLKAQQDIVAQTRADVKQVNRLTESGSTADAVDPTRLQGLRDQLIAIDPVFSKISTSGDEMLRQLTQVPGALDEIDRKLKKFGTELVTSMLSSRLEDPAIKQAMSDVDRQQKELAAATTPRDKQRRLSELTESRQKINDAVLNPFIAQAMSAGEAGVGMDEGSFGDVSKYTKLSSDTLKKIYAQKYLQGATGVQTNVDLQLRKAGKGASDLDLIEVAPGKVVSLKQGGAQVPNPGNNFVLRPTDSEVKDAGAMQQGKNLGRLVNEFQRSIEEIIDRNQEYIKSIDSVNQTIAQGTGLDPSMLAGSRTNIAGVQRMGSALSRIDTTGNFNIKLPTGQQPKEVQNSLFQLIGEVRRLGDESRGANTPSLVKGLKSLGDIEDRGLNGINSAVDKLLKNPQGFDKNYLTHPNAGADDFGDEMPFIKHLRETIGDDAASVAQQQALQAKKLRESGDTQGAAAKEDEVRNTVRSNYKAGMEKVRKPFINAIQENIAQRMGVQGQGIAELGTDFARRGGKNIAEYLKGPDAKKLKDTITGYADVLKLAVEEQRKSLEAETKGTKQYDENLDVLNQLKAAYEATSGTVDHFGERIYNAVEGFDKMNMAIDKMVSQSGFGGAFGQTGSNEDKYAVKFIDDKLSSLQNTLDQTDDKQERAKLERTMDTLRTEKNRRQSNLDVTGAYRQSVGKGVFASGMAASLQGALGLAPEGSGIEEFRKVMKDSITEAMQRVAMDLSPALEGKGPDAIQNITEQMRPMLEGVNKTVRDLKLDESSDYRKNYLLASPSQRAAADQVREAMRQGGTAEQIFGDPYMRQAAKDNPLIGNLLDQAVDSEMIQKSIEVQQNIETHTKETADAIQKLYDAVVNPARMAAGLAPATPQFKKGSMALAGGDSTDPQGRIKRDFTPAYLDKGEIVLNSDQSDHYLRRYNRFATGTMPVKRDTDMHPRLRKALDNLPPVAEGMSRLFRGENPGFMKKAHPSWMQGHEDFDKATEAFGRWFTHDPAIANWYVKDAGKTGMMSYLDLPADKAKQFHLSNMPKEVRNWSTDPDNEFFLPKELAEQRKSLFDMAVRPFGSESIDSPKGHAGTPEWSKQMMEDALKELYPKARDRRRARSAIPGSDEYNQIEARVKAKRLAPYVEHAAKMKALKDIHVPGDRTDAASITPTVGEQKAAAAESAKINQVIADMKKAGEQMGNIADFKDSRNPAALKGANRNLAKAKRVTIPKTVSHDMLKAQSHGLTFEEYSRVSPKLSERYGNFLKKAWNNANAEGVPRDYLFEKGRRFKKVAGENSAVQKAFRQRRTRLSKVEKSSIMQGMGDYTRRSKFDSSMLKYGAGPTRPPALKAMPILTDFGPQSLKGMLRKTVMFQADNGQITNGKLISLTNTGGKILTKDGVLHYVSAADISEPMRPGRKGGAGLLRMVRGAADAHTEMTTGFTGKEARQFWQKNNSLIKDRVVLTDAEGKLTSRGRRLMRQSISGAIENARNVGMDPALMAEAMSRMDIKHGNGWMNPSTQGRSYPLLGGPDKNGKFFTDHRTRVKLFQQTVQPGMDEDFIRKGFVKTMQHEVLHGIDRITMRNLDLNYKPGHMIEGGLFAQEGAPPELKGLFEKLQNQRLQAAMSDTSDAGLMAKRRLVGSKYRKSVRALWRGGSEDKVAAATENFLMEYSAQKAEIQSMRGEGVPMHERQLRALRTEGFLDITDKTQKSRPASEVYSSLADTMKKESAFHEGRGNVGDQPFDIYKALGFDRPDGSTYGMKAGPGRKGTVSPGVKPTKSLTFAERNFPTYFKAKKLPGQVYDAGKAGVEMARSLPGQIKQGAISAYRGIKGLPGAAKSLTMDTILPGLKKSLSYDVLGGGAPEVGGGVGGGLKNLGFGLAIAALHSDAAMAGAKKIGAGTALEHYILPTTDAGLGLMAVRAAATGESLTGFGIGAGLAARGGAMGIAGTGLQFAKMGIGRALIIPALVDATAAAFAGGNRIAYDAGWIDKKTYEDGDYGLKSQQLGKEATTGYLYAHADRLLRNSFNFVRGAGFTSTAQDIQNEVNKGKDIAADMGMTRWQRNAGMSRQDLRHLLDMQEAQKAGAANRDLKSVMLTNLAYLGDGSAVEQAFNAAGGGSDPDKQQDKFADYIKGFEDQIRQLEGDTKEYEDKVNAMGRNAPKDAGDNLVASRKKLDAMRQQLGYLKEVGGGYRTLNGVQVGGQHIDHSFIDLNTVLSGLDDKTRADILGSGARAAYGALAGRMGLPPDAAGAWEEAGRALSRTQPAATVMDLYNAINSTNEQDPNKILSNFMDVKYDKEGNSLVGGVRVLNKDQATRQFGDVGNIQSATKRLNQSADALTSNAPQKMANELAAMKQKEGLDKLNTLKEGASYLFDQASAPFVNMYKQVKLAQRKGDISDTMGDAKSLAKKNALLNSIPQMEYKKVGREKFGRIKGQHDYLYDEYLSDQESELPGLRKESVAAINKSNPAGGFVAAYMKSGAKKAKDTDYFWKKVYEKTDPSFKEWFNAYHGYGDDITALKAAVATNPGDVDSAAKLAESMLKRQQIVQQSGYNPGLFDKVEAASKQLEDQIADRAAKSAEKAVKQDPFQNLPLGGEDAVIHANRHTGGSTNKMGEFTVRNSEGYVPAASDLYDILKMLKGTLGSAPDGLSDAAKSFVGYGPEGGNVSHDHSGSVDVNLNGQEEFIQQIAAAVVQQMQGNMGGAQPMVKGQRVRTPYES